MDSNKVYHFRTLDIKRVWQTILALLLLLSATVAASVALDLPAGWYMAILLVTIGACMFILFRYTWRRESVTLEGARLLSRLYGEIRLQDIKSAGPTWHGPQPSLQLKIRGRRPVSWCLNNGSTGAFVSTPEELEAFRELLRALGNDPQPSQAPAAATGKGPTPHVSRQLRKAAASATKPAIAIPLGLVFSIAILIRTCGPGWLNRNTDIKKLKTASEQLYQHYLEKTNKAVAERLPAEGALFLYTNDTAATLRLFPYIHTDNPLGIAAFEHNQAINDLKEFWLHKDSAKLYTFLTTYDGATHRLDADSSAQQLYCMIYDPTRRMKPAYPGHTDTTAYPLFRIAWDIPPAQAPDKSLPGLKMLLAQLRLHPASRFYMAARQKHGISREMFTAAVHDLNRLLLQVKIDTAAFRTETFNQH